MNDNTYRISFVAAIFLHLLLLVFLMKESSSSSPTMELSQKNTIGPAVVQPPSAEIVKAVSIDNQQVLAEVSRLKAVQEKKRLAEKRHQEQLVKAAAEAKAERLKEQKNIELLKKSAEKMVAEQKKQREVEVKRLAQLKEAEIALEKKQALQAKKLVELKAKEHEMAEKKALAMKEKKKLDDKLKAEKKLKALEEQLAASEDNELLALQKKKQAAVDKANKEAARALEEQKAAESAAKAAASAERQSRIAGEVDKYQALILSAIGQQWILPDQVNKQLSSQFRIRLAPNGAVLEVSLVRSSGDPILDRSAQTAIYKASPLPVPADAETFALFKDINLTVRPENVRG